MTSDIVPISMGTMKLASDGISPLSYQLMQSVGVGSGSSVIRVSSEGEIGTAAVNGHAVIMVTADEMGMGLNQSVVVHVEVSVYCSLDRACDYLIAKLHIVPLEYVLALQFIPLLFYGLLLQHIY